MQKFTEGSFEWYRAVLNQIISGDMSVYQNQKGRIREYGMDDLLKAMDNIRHSDFLRGENKNGWMITFDWFVKPNNFLKVLEGNYNGDRKHESGAKTQRKVEPLIPFGTLGDDGNSDTLPFM